ncbi:hypothetical protein CEXT_118971 [Caerostris extrusa]|uniref:Uncharacterized protein n=1 Tax=Caerostris extrusa TaxID=172846 RepID=A0AAV4XZV7_CAEEX|nr:hypothetical protein CEXT_118971 [Caerostris extrusa]
MVFDADSTGDDGRFDSPPSSRGVGGLGVTVVGRFEMSNRYIHIQADRLLGFALKYLGFLGSLTIVGKTSKVAVVYNTVIVEI